jgi:hypothetical protein
LPEFTWQAIPAGGVKGAFGSDRPIRDAKLGTGCGIPFLIELSSMPPNF